MKKQSDDLKYADALSELQSIVNSLQSGQIGVDDLAEKVQRAAYLIQYCREKLRNTEGVLQNMLGNIE